MASQQYQPLPQDTIGDLSNLCLVCSKALYTKKDSPPIAHDNVFQNHHPTLVSFLAAVDLKCFVCRTVCDNVNYQRQDMLADSRTKDASTAFRLYAKGGKKHDLQLVVAFRGKATQISVVETKFQLLPCIDPATKNYFPRLQMDSETSSSVTLDLAYRWYLSCQNNHIRCNRQKHRSQGWLPSRLLDIGGQGETQWRLVVVSKDRITPAPYATLSYRWGLNQSLKLLKSTFQGFRQGKRISDLPKTFQDSVTVMRRFSIRYLWIDALCIIQDSTEDVGREIPLMQYIYSNSACNLSASASKDPNGGLFRTRDAAIIKPGVIGAPSRAISNGNYYIFDSDYWNRQILNGPLHRRGWVFQERLLSPRIVYFNESQVLWECFTELKCEVFPHGIPQFHSVKNLEPLWEMAQPISQNGQRNIQMSTPSLRLWNSLVREYSNCSLTKPSDKLAAFSGVADLFRETTGDQYLAGLWRSSLLQLLEWWVDQPRIKLSVEHRAPSWSWASIDGPVRPRYQAARAKFLASISAVTPPHISGHLSDFSCDTKLRLLGSLTISTKIKQPMRCTLYPDTLEIKLGVPVPFYFLPLQTASYEVISTTLGRNRVTYSPEVSCLLLEAVLCTMPVVYRRVGHCMTDDTKDISELGLHIAETGFAILEDDSSLVMIAIV